MATWLEVLERLSWRMYRLDSERMRREEPLREELLRRVLIGAAIASLIYLALNASGAIQGRLWLPVEFAVTVGLCAWCLHRGKASAAMVLLLVVMSHPATFLTAHYGIKSAAGALFLPTILVCGLLIGGYFLITWTVICGVLVLVTASAELRGGGFRGFGEVFGVLVFWWGIFSATGWLVHLFSRHLEDMVNLTQMAERKRRLAIIEERTRIAREIHDTLAQGFTGIVVQLNAAEEIVQTDVSRSRQHLARARQLARYSLEEARRSVLALRPESLERGNLAAAIEGVADRLILGTKIRLDIRTDGQECSLPTEIENNVLRICQEAITNSVRHAQPDHITVSLHYLRESLRTEIKDDGNGMKYDEAMAKLGLGLTGMQERAEQLGGRIEVRSVQGNGTSIVAVIPLHGRQGDNV